MNGWSEEKLKIPLSVGTVPASVVLIVEVCGTPLSRGPADANTTQFRSLDWTVLLDTPGALNDCHVDEAGQVQLRRHGHGVGRAVTVLGHDEVCLARSR